MQTTKKHLFWLVLLNILFTLSFWAIFKFNIPRFFGHPDTSILTLFSNYDGPNYLVVSKCGYDPNCIRTNFSLPLPIEYYPAHFPGYPLLIKISSFFISGPWSMLFVTFLGGLFLTVTAYYFFKLYVSPKSSFWLSLLFLIFPGRFFVTRVIGAPETWFVGSLLASIIFYKKEKFFYSALFLVLAQSLKTPAVLLLIAYVLQTLATKKNIFRLTPYVLVPISVLLIMYYQGLQTGDFLAYFHSGDNRHLAPMPYQVFLGGQPWVGSIWLEEILYVYILAFLTIYRLQKKYKLDVSVVFTWLFTLAIIFVGHRDISRYASPLYPFILLSFEKVLVNKHTKLLFLLLLPAVFLYAINFVIGNTTPVADWTPYL